MKEFFSSIPNRWKAVYLIWVAVNLILLIAGGQSGATRNKFFPFEGDLGVYDIEEFILFLAIPIIIFLILKFWNKDKIKNKQKTILKEKTDKSNELNKSIESSKENWVDISPKKQPKWGWGWYILAFIVFAGVNKTYEYLGDNKGLLFLFGISICLIVYFYCRNRALTKISNINLRSLTAGIISLIITVVSISLLSFFIVKIPIGADTYLSELSKTISNETKIVKAQLDERLSDFKKLQSELIIDPRTEEEIKNNIRILSQEMYINKVVDSISSNFYNKIYSFLYNAEKRDPNKIKESGLTSELVNSLINKLNITTSRYQGLNTALINYYNAYLLNSPNQDLLWERYENKQKEFENVQAEYYEILGRFNVLSLRD